MNITNYPSLSSIHYRFVDDPTRAAIGRAQSFAATGEIAVDVLRRHGRKVVMVSAPITSGDKIPGWENIDVFRFLVERVDRVTGGQVFSPMAFEEHLGQLAQEWRRVGGKGYCYELINGFYRRVFCSGYVQLVFFAHSWRSSVGCQMEHEICQSLGIPRIYLKPTDTLIALEEAFLLQNIIPWALLQPHANTAALRS